MANREYRDALLYIHADVESRKGIAALRPLFAVFEVRDVEHFHAGSVVDRYAGQREAQIISVQLRDPEDELAILSTDPAIIFTVFISSFGRRVQ